MKCIYHLEGQECPHMTQVGVKDQTTGEAELVPVCTVSSCPAYQEFRQTPNPTPEARLTRTINPITLLEIDTRKAYNSGKLTEFNRLTAELTVMKRQAHIDNRDIDKRVR